MSTQKGWSIVLSWMHDQGHSILSRGEREGSPGATTTNRWPGDRVEDDGPPLIRLRPCLLPMGVGARHRRPRRRRSGHPRHPSGDRPRRDRATPAAGCGPRPRGGRGREAGRARGRRSPPRVAQSEAEHLRRCHRRRDHARARGEPLRPWGRRRSARRRRRRLRQSVEQEEVPNV